VVFLKALITGASGFVGSAMTKYLLAKNIEVLGISRSKSYLNNIETKEFCCDILQREKLEKIVNEYKPDYIIHLASPAFIPNSISSPSHTYNTIFLGTLNVLESIRNNTVNAKMLYVSSADVYGSHEGVLFETDSYNPINPYSSAKACSEMLCRQYVNNYGMDIVIARPFNHTGPGQSSDFVCSNFAYQIATLKDSRKLYTGNIDVKRDFLDIDDVVDAYFKLLLYGAHGQIYNVCSGQAISIRKIIEILFKNAGVCDYEIEVDPQKVRENDISLRIGSNARICKDVGWAPTVEMEETLYKLYLYWKEKLHV
jgi:GDP-4-dehydro-6-deoxy-D-mannose reductase